MPLHHLLQSGAQDVAIAADGTGRQLQRANPRTLIKGSGKGGNQRNAEEGQDPLCNLVQFQLRQQDMLPNVCFEFVTKRRWAGKPVRKR